MPDVVVEVGEVICRKTEDIGPFGSRDELYLVGNVSGGTINNAVVTDKLSIDNGEHMRFSNGELFRGWVADGQPVRISLAAREADSSEFWKNKKELIDIAQGKIDEKWARHQPDGSVTGARDPSNDQAREVLRVVIDALQSVAEMDGDDLLGTLAVDIPVDNRAVVSTLGHSWQFYGDGADYRVSIKVSVRRDGATDEEVRAFYERMDRIRRGRF